jgi:hypothetical protein
LVSEDWQRVCDETESDHVDILTAVHRLESGVLLARADAEHQQWPDVVRRELAALVAFFEKHSNSSEQPDGLIGQIEAMHGRSEQVTALVANHGEILKSARILLQDLERIPPGERFRLSKGKIAHLTAAIREHEGREMDLIYETDSRVLGGQG